MFNKLQTKWKVSAGRLMLIIATFAIGGSLCGYVGKKLLAFADIEKGVWWVLLYIITITILWPISVIIVSIPCGQFAFFKTYLSSMYKKIMLKRNLKDKNQKTH